MDTPTTVKFPHVQVKLIGRDGNVFVIIGAVSIALKAAGLRDEATQFFHDAMSQPSYDDVLRLVMDTVTIL